MIPRGNYRIEDTASSYKPHSAQQMAIDVNSLVMDVTKTANGLQI